MILNRDVKFFCNGKMPYTIYAENVVGILEKKDKNSNITTLVILHTDASLGRIRPAFPNCITQATYEFEKYRVTFCVSPGEFNKLVIALREAQKEKGEEGINK